MKTVLLNKSTDTYYQYQPDGKLAPININEVPTSINILLTDNSCHVLKVDMPIKQTKQIIKALPFAIEEQLAGEVDDQHIVYLGKKGTQAYAQIISSNIMTELSEIPNLTNISSLALNTPYYTNCLSIALVDDTAAIRVDEFHGVSVPLILLAKSLDQIIKDNPHVTSAIIYPLNGQDTSLLTAQLQSIELDTSIGEPGDIFKAQVQVGNLLSGEFKPASTSTEGRPFKFSTPLALLSLIIIFFMIINTIKVNQLESQTKAVTNASIEYYGKLFPGEKIRPRILKRSFREQVENQGQGGGSSSNFSKLLSKTATQVNKISQLSIETIKYSKNKNQLELIILSDSISRIDSLKQSLTSLGLQVDIASANQAGNQVKGILKVKSND